MSDIFFVFSERVYNSLRMSIHFQAMKTDIYSTVQHSRNNSPEFTLRSMLTRGYHDKSGGAAGIFQPCNPAAKAFAMAIANVNAMSLILNKRYIQLFAFLAHTFGPDTCLNLPYMGFAQIIHAKARLSYSAAYA